VPRALLATALAVTVLAVGASEAQEPPGSAVRQVSAGPCNMITVNVNVDDVQESVFKGFVAHPGSTLGRVSVDDIKAYFTINIRTGRLQCSTDDSSSRVVMGARRTPARVERRENDARVTIVVKPRRER
jgi:hypothetical protein